MTEVDHKQVYVNVAYPLLLRRYKATTIDVLLVLFANIMIMLIGQLFPEPAIFIVPLVILITLLYEPLLTVYSATLGQRWMGVRVRDGHDPFKRITIWQSYARFFVKYLLGWISFFTIHSNDQRRGIHDFAGTTVMVSVECLE